MSCIISFVALAATIALYYDNAGGEAQRLRAKRAYLSVLLAEPIDEALRTAKKPRSLFQMKDAGPTAKGWIRFAVEGYAALPALDASLDLHEQLIMVADEGDEKIAGFIESYRTYKRQLRTVADFQNDAEYQTEVLSQAFEGRVGKEVAQLHEALSKLEVRGMEALRLLQNRLPPVEVLPYEMRLIERHATK